MNEYQVMPPLSPEEYEELKADIKERGVMIPIEFDEDGNTLDAVEKSGAKSVLFIARHGTSDTIVAKDAKLAEAYWHHRWIQQFHSMTLGDAIESFIRSAKAKECDHDSNKAKASEDS